MRSPRSRPRRGRTRPDLEYPVGVLADGAEQAGRLAERLPERSLGLALELHEHRADLEPDAARLEQGQPGAREGASLAEAELAVAELEQQVEMGVGDHGRESTRWAVGPAARSALRYRMLTSPLQPL